MSTSTSIPKEGEAAQPLSAAECGLNRSDGVFLQRSWELAIASRSASDHQQWVDGFFEDVEKLIEHVEHLPQDQQGPCGSVELATRSYEMAVVHAFALANGGEADDENYKDAADVANLWLKQLSLQGEVPPFEPKYKDSEG